MKERMCAEHTPVVLTVSGRRHDALCFVDCSPSTRSVAATGCLCAFPTWALLTHRLFNGVLFVVSAVIASRFFPCCISNIWSCVESRGFRFLSAILDLLGLSERLRFIFTLFSLFFLTLCVRVWMSPLGAIFRMGQSGSSSSRLHKLHKQRPATHHPSPQTKN